MVRPIVQPSLRPESERVWKDVWIVVQIIRNTSYDGTRRKEEVPDAKSLALGHHACQTCRARHT